MREKVIPHPLLDILKSLEFEENGGLIILSSEYRDEDLDLRISINAGTSETFQTWKVKCIDVKAEQISHEWENELDVFNEHPILWPLSSISSELYMLGPAKIPSAVYGDIVTVHTSAVGRWLHPNAFLNTSFPLLELLSSSGGLVARGPRKLLSLYAQVLFSHSIKYQLLPEIVPNESNSCPYKVLLIGNSYIVAKDFIFADPPSKI